MQATQPRLALAWSRADQRQLEYEQTGLRVIAEDAAEAERLWLEHGGRCGNDAPDYIMRIETDEYGPELPRGTWIGFANTHVGGHDGDLVYRIDEREGRFWLRYICHESPGETFIHPADPSDALDLCGDVELGARGLLLFDANGRATYRPANRYARVGYELIGEQRSRARGGGRGENSPGASTPEG